MLDTLIIQNFKFGLDTRRSELTSQPGTLEVGENGHVNAGGEFEKRKAFVPAVVTNFPATTFGLQDTDAGLVTFGSVDSGSVGTLPTGVTYQRLQDGLSGAMTGLINSTNLNGKAFALAEFTLTSGGNTQIMTRGFYDGVLVLDFSNGIVWLGNSLTTLGDSLVTQITASLDEWSAANASGVVTVKSPVDVHFTPTTTENSAAGGFVPPPYLSSQNQPAIAAVSASAAVRFLTGSPGDFFTIRSTATTPYTTLGTATWSTTATQMATDMAAAINALTNTHGYRARADADKVSVFAPPGAYYNGKAFDFLLTGITYDTNVSPEADNTTAVLHIDPAFPQKVVQTRRDRSMFVRTPNVAAVGGVAPFTWSEFTTGSGNGIVISATTGVQVSFSKNLTMGQSVVGKFKVVDSAGAPVTFAFDVYLSLENLNIL